jgi:hypothetical protein
VECPISGTQEIGVPQVDAEFTIAGEGGVEADGDPEDNDQIVSVGVPDLVVRSFTVEPSRLKADEPLTFTVVIENQGTGPAWNPANKGGFWIDVFTNTIPSYPFERYGFAYEGSPALMPGVQRTVVITHEGFTLEQLANITDGFYVRVDNDVQHPYGLVPESDEGNNVAGPLAIWTHVDYLPLVFRRR